ncbi:RluA family pseudouridine synthase [Deferribacter autotrophicus]|uniref:RluA family pseudouridine synthase n=1 Tax=Deferribacter autotrophicus TaxID=500465 RepID=A0A5A8F7U9_9BACT|nr:RluA family pseudouridine synthase [Deferribacter autotrophicus]KAA0259203.1 RluA family pseudouridine synthase [Deferribacter autotrophicus]
MSQFFKKYDKLYEDDDILVVCKDHGVLVIPDRYDKDLFNLKNHFDDVYGKIFVVHRLDAGTGGLVVFAKNSFAHKKLSLQFQNNAVKKKYFCITEGVLKYPFTTLLPISKRNYHGKYKINFKSGRKSITTFYPLSYNERYSFVEAVPKTGRSHQIRVHLKAYKTPLMQDYLYNKKIDDKRLTLFAYFLEFEHPATGKTVQFKAKLFDFMEEKLKEAGLSYL